MTSRASPALYLGTVTTGSGRPISSPDVQEAIARALLNTVPTTHPAPVASERPVAERAG